MAITSLTVESEMTTAVAVTAREKIEAEVARYREILRVRGGFWEDEKAAHDALAMVLSWMDDDLKEQERIELEALEVQIAAEEEERRKPEQTRALFDSYRKKLKEEGRMR